MNILHVEPELKAGGATRYLAELADGFAAAGHRVVVAARAGAWTSRLDGAVRHVTDVDLRPDLPFLGLPNVPGLVRSSFVLGRLVREERIELIHTHHRAASLAAKPVARHAGIPMISSVHELGRRYRRLSRATFGDRVLVLSDYARRRLVDDDGIDERRVVVIPFGIDPPPAPRPDQLRRLRAELTIPDDAPVIGLVGRLVRRKGQRILVDAMPEVLARHPDVYAIIIGEGPDRAFLDGLVAHSIAGTHLRLAGHRNDVSDLMAMCRFMVQPSRGEAFGISLIEAMAMRRAVIATSVGGMPEIVRHGETGLLVPPDDAGRLAEAMNRLLDEPALAWRLGEGGYALIVRRYGRRRFLDDVERVYRGAIGRVGRSGTPRATPRVNPAE
jgi:glycosyltransferase involved in cell wall biosynthesis